ncbi:MAG: CCA tRNA nucleotidyltransferase [Nitrososphaeraceae archaeon]
MITKNKINSKIKNQVTTTRNNNSIKNHIEPDLDRVIHKALKASQPNKLELKRLRIVEKEIINEIKNNLVPEVVAIKSGGSFAKGTNLKNDTDIDIFILIDKKVSESHFEGIAMDIGFKALSKYTPRTRFSEHPYVEGFVRKNKNEYPIRINIVPCYAVEKGNWKSAADRSQYHTEYMTKNLTKDQKDQVRILKKFLKTIGIYGAEMLTSGFSGYVSEVLVLKYNTFKDVLLNISNLGKKETVISTHENKAIDETKFHSPIIIIDPIDENRNLGAAISAESLSKFIMASRTFLKHPSMYFFNFQQSFTKVTKVVEDQKKSDILSNLIIIKFHYSSRSPDIISGQLKKLTKAITKQTNSFDFNVIKSQCYIKDECDLALIVLLLEFKKLPSYMVNKGPDIFMKDEVSNFIKKNKNNSIFTWINEEMKIFCLKERKNDDIIEFLKEAMTSNTEIGIPKGLRSDLKKGVGLFFLDSKKIGKDPIYQDVLYDFVFKNSMIFED